MAWDITYDEIKRMTPTQIRRLSDSQLRRAAQVMANVANKRIARLMKDPETRHSPWAVRGIEAAKRGEKTFTLKGAKNRAQVKAKFDQARSFLSSRYKTHTVKGFKEVKAAFRERVGDLVDSSEFWQAYKRIEQKYGGQWPGGYDSFEAQRIVARMLRNGENVADIERFFDEAYEREQAEFYTDWADWEFDDYESGEDIEQ